jgi:hypothetical protein
MTTPTRPSSLSTRRSLFTVALGVLALATIVLVWAGLCAWALRQLGILG